MNIIGKRPDGYHELESVMQAVSLCDDVTVRMRYGAGGADAATVSMDTGDAYIAAQAIPADGRNTVLRAAEAYFVRGGPRGGRRADIHIRKRIPAAAGLAGGSADAAAVLCALNDIAAQAHGVDGVRPLTEAELLEAAFCVGADVPFCLLYGTEGVEGGSAPHTAYAWGTPHTEYAGGAPHTAYAWGTPHTECAGGAPHTAFATGVGEKLRRVPRPPPRYAVALANPRMEVSTARVFAAYSPPPDYEIEKISKLTRAMIESHIEDWTRCYNALERSVTELHPEIGRLKTALLGAGALCAVMSGSGPTVFGLFDGADNAARAAEAIRGGGAWTAVCEFL